MRQFLLNTKNLAAYTLRAFKLEPEVAVGYLATFQTSTPPEDFTTYISDSGDSMTGTGLVSYVINPSGTVTCNSAIDHRAMVNRDLGSGDFTYTNTIDGAGAAYGLIFRHTDTNNFLNFRISPTNANVLEIDAGSASVIANATSAAQVGYHVATVVCSGTLLTCSWSDKILTPNSSVNTGIGTVGFRHLLGGMMQRAEANVL